MKEGRFIDSDPRIVREVNAPEVHDVEENRRERAPIATGNSIMERLCVKEKSKGGCVMQKIVNSGQGK